MPASLLAHEMTHDQLMAWMAELHRQMDAALAETGPPRPQARSASEP